MSTEYLSTIINTKYHSHHDIVVSKSGDFAYTTLWIQIDENSYANVSIILVKVNDEWKISHVHQSELSQNPV